MLFLISRIHFLPGPEPLTQITSLPPASTSTTFGVLPSAVNRPAACPETGKRQVETPLANLAAQYLGGKVPASSAGADFGGTERAFTARSRKPQRRSHEAWR